jgi:hypothetical protein
MRQALKKVLENRPRPLIVAALVMLPASAWAWSDQASFETHIHGHEFSRVTLESSECQLKVRILFDAPEAAYKNEAPARNYYRFHARIKLDDGRGIITRVFYNTAPGARAYSYVLDTAADSCFAKQEHKIRGIDVEGCRGTGCTPEPFK